MILQGSPPTVSILVATKNDEATIHLTLDSLACGVAHYKRLGGRAEVIIVNDGSNDKTLEILDRWRNAGSIRNLRIESQPNAGVTKALNRAFALCSAESRYIIRMDADAVFVANDWLYRFVTFLESDDRIGAVAPCIVNPKGIIEACGINYFSENSPMRREFLSWGTPVLQYPHSRECIEEVDAFLGTAACFRRECWSIDERYFLWHEDIDQALTVRLKGKKVFVMTDIVLYHLGYGYLRGRRIDQLDPEDPSNFTHLLRLSFSSFCAAVIGMERWSRIARFIRGKGRFGVNKFRPLEGNAVENAKYFLQKWGFNEDHIDLKYVRNRYRGTELCWRWDENSRKVSEEIRSRYREIRERIPQESIASLGE